MVFVMIDIVFPKGNEKEFISIAKRLGLKGLCLVYDRPTDIASFQKDSDLKLISGVLCSPDDVRKYKGKHMTICRAPDDQSKIRTIIEQSKPDIIYGLESARRKDFIHHRASGLNHVMAQLAAEKGVSVGFSLSDVLAAKLKDRPVIMGRMMQNIRFARKYGFGTVFASFAGEPYDMRAKKDISSFFVCLGMSGVVGLEVGK